jgi:hypothetical protein
VSEAPEWTGELRYDLDELTAYDAMVRFLFNWWDRSGRPQRSVFEQGDVLWLLSACDRSTSPNSGPPDPAMWHDWKQALADVRREGPALPK